MKKKYTRKQICEAISYWKKQLNESGTYLDGSMAFAAGPTDGANFLLSGTDTIDNLLEQALNSGHDIVILANNNDGSFVAYGCTDEADLVDVALAMLHETT